MISEDARQSGPILDAEALRVVPLTAERRLGTTAPSASLYVAIGKPLIDRVGAAVLLVVTSPIMLAVAIAVGVRIGRPIIFSQTRVGRDGVHFRIYKFCTMAGDRRAQDAPFVGADRRLRHKCDDDPRLSPLGRRLRRWSVDELPQLWNVLRGEMSLVGPRPELPVIVSRFAPWQHERHVVKPGLTGTWQVYGRGDGHVMHERTELDIEYVRSITLRTDLKLMALTLPAVLGLKRGY